MPIEINTTITIPHKELQFQFTRSSGPGGQNVNKVSSRVELLFDIGASNSLSEHEKQIIRSKLKTRIDSDGILHIASQESRSQWKNRETVEGKFAELVRAALIPQKKRFKTKPSRTAHEVRIKTKKSVGSKKQMRSKVHFSGD